MIIRIVGVIIIVVVAAARVVHAADGLIVLRL